MEGNFSVDDWDDAHFDWENAYTSSAQEFFTDFTLHDSYWAGLRSEPEKRELICIFQFDQIWNPTIVSNSDAAPYLLIRFAHCYQLTFSDNRDHSTAPWPEVVVDAHSEPLSEAAYGPLQKVVTIGSSAIYHTVFEGPDQEAVHIIHSGGVQVRCYNWSDGSEIPIRKPEQRS